MLDVEGGIYPHGGESTYQIWVSLLPIQTDQTVVVMFLEDAVASHAGKTIDELFPDEPTSNQTDFSVTPQIIAELKARTQHREKFTLMYSASSGAAFQGTTNADEDAFAFSVLWTAEQPELARVSLHRYAFESLQTRGPLHYLVMDRLGVGDSVRFSVS